MVDTKSELIVYHMQKLSIAKQAEDRYSEAGEYCNLGNAYYSVGDFKQAIENHKLDLNISKEVGDKAGEGRAYENLGYAFASLGNFKQALDYHKLHLNIAKELCDRTGEGVAYSNLGNAFRNLGYFKQAIENHKLALDIFKEVENRAAEGRAHQIVGNTYHSLGDFKQAIEYLKLGLSIAKEVGDRVGEGKSYQNLGDSYRCLGAFKQAMEYHKLHLSIAKEVGDRAGDGEAHANLGIVYDYLGDFKQAVEHHKQDLNIATEVGDKGGEGKAYGNLGNCYVMLGDFNQSIKYHKLHLSITKEVGDRAGEGKAYGNLGCAYYGVNDFKQAIEYHKLQVTIAKEVRDRAEEGRAYGNLGNTYDSLGDFKQAVKYHKLDLRIAKEVGDRAGEGSAYVNLGNAYYSLDDFEQATDYYKLNLTIAKEVGDRVAEGSAYGKLGIACYSLGDFKQAVEYHKLGLSIAKEVGDRAREGENYRNLGNAYCSLHDFEQAREYYKLDLSIAKEIGARVGEGSAYTNLGHVFYNLGDFKEAVDYYRLGVNVLDSTRALLQSENSWKISFRESFSVAYTALWSTLVKIGETDEALFAAEKGRAQALMDVLKTQYGIHALPSKSVEPEETISYILNALSLQTAFVALNNNAISFWVLTKGSGVRFKQTEMEHDFATSLIKSTLKAIGAGVGVRCENRSLDELGDDSQSNTEARDGVEPSANSLRPMYDAIIGPIADLLEGDQLIVVPDGPLCLVPYSALSESIRIRIVPSLTALKLIAGLPEDFHSKSGALLVGDPCLKEVTNKQGNPILPQLQYAREEVEMIGKLIKAKTLMGNNATKEEVLKRISSVALVHIAAHGSEETGEIALAPNPGRLHHRVKDKDYILKMSDLEAIRLKARLVVLSCCHSGRGEIKAEGVVGMARAFLCAGARSILVSLWAIDDEATLLFMKVFYQQLADGKCASVALQQAMRSLRESEKFGAAKYWAPFVLIGDDVTLDFGEQKST